MEHGNADPREVAPLSVFVDLKTGLAPQLDDTVVDKTLDLRVFVFPLLYAVLMVAQSDTKIWSITLCELR